MDVLILSCGTGGGHDSAMQEYLEENPADVILMPILFRQRIL